MSVRCVFYTGRQSQPCEVLGALGATPLSATVRKLAARYCRSGQFISCPIFCRVESQLSEINGRLHRVPRDQRPELCVSADPVS